MKKLMICVALISGLIFQGYPTSAQTTDPTVIKNDPDWQTIAAIEGNFVDRLVSAKIDLANFDLNNEKLVLSTVGMTKDEYLKNVDQVRAAANSLVKRYGISSADCSSCSLDINTKNDMVRSEIAQFKVNPAIYSRFRTESLGLADGTNKATSCCCCGWGFYGCVTLCALSIEIFPVYLACCAVCHHTQCCSN